MRSDVVALGKQSQPACRELPHHFSCEVPKAPRRGSAATRTFVMIHNHIIKLKEYLCRAAFAANHDLTRASPKRFPVIAPIDGIDAEAGRQEEHLQFAREKDVHV